MLALAIAVKQPRHRICKGIVCMSPTGDESQPAWPDGPESCPVNKLKTDSRV